MINFTDVTGLASSVMAMTALAVRLPGVMRMQSAHYIFLVSTIALGVLIPFDGLPLAAFVRGWIGDLSIPSVILLALGIFRPLCGGVLLDGKDKTALLLLITVLALGLYPMALGLGYFDPYRLGYGNVWFIVGLLLIALFACWKNLPQSALVIALGIFAWGGGWYESNNLWDYLLDPFLAIYAIYALLRCRFSST